MFNHEPKDYDCPFCGLVAGREDKYNNMQDVVYHDKWATAFIAPRWWVNNPGGVIVVPNGHHENLYDIPDDELAGLYKVVKKLALAIRSSYDCEGVSTRQHNEPAGGQDVWHMHVHVFARHEGDQLYLNDDNKRFVDAQTREPYAIKLKNYFNDELVV